MKIKKILIFGVFDGIHEGHLYFINNAKKQGDQLIAVVARDSIVKKLKGKIPNSNEVDRINSLLEVPSIDLVLLGDPDIGTYNILREINPDIIYLGYDQNELHGHLLESIKNNKLISYKILQGDSYKPEIFHSSIINKKKI